MSKTPVFVSKMTIIWEELYEKRDECFTLSPKNSNFATSYNKMTHLRSSLILTIVMWGCFWLCCPQTAESKDFVVVIDAGHGGKDPGAVGKKAREKDINLNVALKVGKLIEKNCAQTRVIYTRQKDVFVSLDRRARIANEAKADLFISIHTNALPKGKIARGTETYTLGMARADENLEVAKRENAVILVEDNYEEHYAGFNPNSAESYIMFEFMQDKYMEQSVSLARLIQGQFKSHARRIDKGVHQAGFLVLRATSMPSVLIELGYISTPDEERYLSSEAGCQALSQSIYNAFIKYKESETGGIARPAKAATAPAEVAPTATQPEKKPEAATPQPEKETGQPVFKVQILTTNKPLPANSSKLKGLEAGYYMEDGLCKYTCGETTDYNKIVRIRKEVEKKFKDAFIIAFKEGKKMNVQEAIKEFKKKKK